MQIKIGEIGMCAQQVSKELADYSLVNSMIGLKAGLHLSVIHDAFYFCSENYYNLNFKSINSFVVKCAYKLAIFFLLHFVAVIIPFIVAKNVLIKWDCTKVEADFYPVVNSEFIFAVQYTTLFSMGYLAYHAMRKTKALHERGALNDKVTLSAIFAIMISLTGLMGFCNPDLSKHIVDSAKRCIDQKR